MLQLAAELRTGRYRPHPPVQIQIAKADGGCRTIAVYMLRDRVAQRAALEVLDRRTDSAMSPASFGYRLGRGVAAALSRVRALINGGYPWVVDADVERCFDSIPRDVLLAEVRRRAGTAEGAELVARCLGWNDPEARQETGIPQGACLAPWLCNVYLWRFDDRMADEGLPLVRYADDFVTLAPTRVLAERALAVCEDTLRSLRLRLNPLKTRLVNAARPFRFLGEWIGMTPLLGCACGPATLAS
jgi:group II intron reverse transcriptase/maturase